MSKFIEIIVAPNGKSRIETKGFAGGECREASRLIERALGVKAAEQLTSEFYQPQKNQVRRQQTS